MALTRDEPGKPDQLVDSSGFGQGLPLGGYCLWKWLAQARAWSLLKDESKVGFEPGPAPQASGQFDGQIVRWPSVRRPAP